MGHDVFISYSSKNKAAADATCHILENNSIKCWMAPRDIPAGSEYGDLIDKAIKTSKVVVVVFSQTAAESQWVKGELNIAFEEQKVIIPYRIDQTPFSGQNRVILNQKHWIDAFPDYQTKFQDLVDAVNSALGNHCVDPHVDAQSRTSKTVWFKEHKRHLLYGIMAIALVAIVCCLVICHTNKFTYNKNGLILKDIENLDESQKLMLTEILDNMVFVEGGNYMMGNDYNNLDYLTSLDSLSVNPHKVNLDSYYISKFEVTQAQWRAFANVAGCYLELGEKSAIDNISWEEAKAFAETLSNITGLNISLPTEAQWEYAAKGGRKSKHYPFSGFEDGLNHYAWSIADGINSGADVGVKLPNELGLYDMTGNVSEWCLDDFVLYSPLQSENPNIEIGNKKKIFRGGDFRTPNIMDMKTSSRYYAPAFSKREGTGLRLVINQ